MRKRKVLIAVVIVVLSLSIFLVVGYVKDIKKAYNRIEMYDAKSINTEFGKLNYVDIGEGVAVLISHGIFGGYDQGSSSLNNILGSNYRKISPSRFGYTGSDVPDNPTPANQATAYLRLMDELNIDKGFVLTTSAGGAAGIKFAIMYPDRVKGLILLSSGVPANKRSREEITEMLGPPAFLVNDFPMWLSLKYFKFVFSSMFASEVPDDLSETMLPVGIRNQGIKIDSEITNMDMDLNYDDYIVEDISAPILVVHAKDDPMTKFESMEKFLSRVDAETAIFETGGHLISGNGNKVNERIIKFIESNK